MARPKILAIDDEPAILRIIKESLEDRFDVITAGNAQDAIAYTIDEKPALILIDNIMPGMSGLDTVKTIRKALSTSTIPIIMVTAQNDSINRIEAFRSGIDDFISKPFDPDELLARVEAKILRFNKTPTDSQQESKETINIGNLSVNEQLMQIKVNERGIRLTGIEAKILAHLVKRKDNLVNRVELLSEVWGGRSSDERIIDIHINTLRKKLAAFNGKIETVYGRGYVIRSPGK